MLKSYNTYLIQTGNTLRNKLIFDIFEPIDYASFLKVKFFKNQYKNNILLKFR